VPSLVSSLSPRTRRRLPRSFDARVDGSIAAAARRYEHAIARHATAPHRESLWIRGDVARRSIGIRDALRADAIDGARNLRRKRVPGSGRVVVRAIGFRAPIGRSARRPFDHRLACGGAGASIDDVATTPRDLERGRIQIRPRANVFVAAPIRGFELGASDRRQSRRRACDQPERKCRVMQDRSRFLQRSDRRRRQIRGTRRALQATMLVMTILGVIAIVAVLVCRPRGRHLDVG
jgi:hypothetical protein